MRTAINDWMAVFKILVDADIDSLHKTQYFFEASKKAPHSAGIRYSTCAPRFITRRMWVRNQASWIRYSSIFQAPTRKVSSSTGLAVQFIFPRE